MKQLFRSYHTRVVSSNRSCCTKGRSSSTFVSPLAGEDWHKRGKKCSFPKSQPDSLRKPSAPWTIRKAEKEAYSMRMCIFEEAALAWLHMGLLHQRFNCCLAVQLHYFLHNVLKVTRYAENLTPKNLAESLGHWEASGQALGQQHFKTTSSVWIRTP